MAKGAGAGALPNLVEQRACSRQAVSSLLPMVVRCFSAFGEGPGGLVSHSIRALVCRSLGLLPAQNILTQETAGQCTGHWMAPETDVPRFLLSSLGFEVQGGH